MMSWLLTVERPWAVYLLMALPIFIGLRWSLLLYRRQTKSIFGHARVRKKVMIDRSVKWYHQKTFLLVAGWTMAVGALLDLPGKLSGAESIKQEKLLRSGYRQKANEYFLVIDASASMSVDDMPRRQTRLSAAKEIGELILERLIGQSVALYAFTSDATALVPPTFDYLFTLLSLRQIEINEGGGSGTDLSVMLERVLADIDQEGIDFDRTIILLTDGEDLEEEAQTKEQHQKLFQQVEKFKSKNLHLFTIGLGSSLGGIIPHVSYQGGEVHSVPDFELLRTLAHKGNGEYFFASSTSFLELTQELILALPKTSKGKSEQRGDIPVASNAKETAEGGFFQLLLAGAIFSLLAVLLLPDTDKRELT